MIRVPFTKMVGTGNDFIVVDTVRHPLPALRRRWPAVSKALCDRHHGIGADGLLILQPSRTAEVKMRVLNPDGSEAEMCGNGARCVALYVQHARSRGRPRQGRVRLETRAGVLMGEVRGGQVAMRMTDPTELRLDQDIQVQGRRFGFGFINTGVPHAVVPVAALARLDVQGLGRELRHHRAFAPRGTNVDFIEADARRRNRLRVRTYERGVEAETLACGTGVAAAAVMYALARAGGNGKERRQRIDVETKSGHVLGVAFTVTPGPNVRVTDVVLEGPAVRVFEGAVPWPLTGGLTQR